MISINEQKEFFSTINEELHSKTSDFIQQLLQTNLEFSLKTTKDAQNEGFIPNQLYYIESGTVGVDYEEKDLFLFEQGDIFIPHCIEEYEEAELYFSVKSELQLKVVSLDSLFEVLAKDKQLIALWFSINQLLQLQVQQMIGSLTRSEERANPGFKRFAQGQVIIQEGDLPDYVYSVTSGTAVAVHNGVEVGEIKQDEIFGAIAVLTNQRRSASVLAKTDCTVLMVHRDEFSKMVHSHPDLFLNILKDLSNTITALNKKVSGA